MAKKVITIFFLFIFVLQVIPVKQVGRLISQSSFIEELPEKTPSKSVTGFEDHIKHFLSHDNYLGIALLSNSCFCYIHLSETLPVSMASDVQTPPPNFS